MTDFRKPPSAEKPMLGIGADPLLDSNEAAAFLGVHPRTLQRMVLRGEIRAVRVGKLYRFKKNCRNGIPPQDRTGPISRTI